VKAVKFGRRPKIPIKIEKDLPEVEFSEFFPKAQHFKRKSSI
jgi:hypothetical protein